MKTLGQAVKIFIFFTILTGICYPLLVTLIGRVFFPYSAEGSLIEVNGVKRGSELIGQKSDSAVYFSSRPSAVFWNPLPSGGSNLALTNSRLRDSLKSREKRYTLYNRLDSNIAIPSEMVFASGSGLDPHISLRAALQQVSRISAARKFDDAQKEKLIRCIKAHVERPQFLIFGEERVNVLLLNLDIDKIK